MIFARACEARALPQYILAKKSAVVRHHPAGGVEFDYPSGSGSGEKTADSVIHGQELQLADSTIIRRTRSERLLHDVAHVSGESNMGAQSQRTVDFPGQPPFLVRESLLPPGQRYHLHP